MGPYTSGKGQPIRVVLADDHELVLEGLRAVLQHEPDIEVVAAVTDGVRLLEAVRRLAPDLVVLDIRMPYADGLTCLQKIRQEGLETRVLILTAFDDRESVLRAFELEADGLALKTASPQQTVAAIRQVFHGHMVFPRTAARWLKGRWRASPAEDPLSPREREVLALVAQGLTNAQIAERLTTSEHTVKFHLKNIYQKLGVTNRTEAAVYYHRHYPSQA